MCIELVNYWDKYTEMHGQQNVNIQWCTINVSLYGYNLKQCLWRRKIKMGVVKFYFWIWKDVLLTLVTVSLFFRLYFGCFCYITIFGALITLIEFGVQLGAPSCRSRFEVCQVTLWHKLRIRFLTSKRVNNIISTYARLASITRFMGPWTMNQSGQASTKTHVN